MRPPARPVELLSPRDLAGIARRLGTEISVGHPRGVVLVGVLSGSVCLLADVLRCVTVACAVDFLALSSYAPGAVRVQVLHDLGLDLSDRDVVVVEDVVDTGLSARYVCDLVTRHGARRVRLCALADRPGRRIVPLEVDYVGLEAPEDFLVGYGLGLAGRYRNLPGLVSLGVADPDVDADELDAALRRAALYGTRPA